MHRGTDYIYSYSDNRRRRPEEPSPLLPAFNPGQPIFVPGSPPKRHRPTVPIYATPESSRHYQTPSFASPERSNPNPGPSIFKTPERKEYSSNFLTPLSSHVCNDGLSMYTPEHKSKLVLSPSRRGPYSTASVVSSPVRNRAREASPVRRGESSHTRDRDDSDYSIYSDLKLRQAVYVRQFEFDKVNDETIWTTWQNGTILRSHVQMAYVGYALSFYEVQVTGKSMEEMPTVITVGAFNGGIWDGYGKQPTISASRALWNEKRFKTVFVWRNSSWIPARVINCLFTDPLMVVYHPRYRESSHSLESDPLTQLVRRADVRPEIDWRTCPWSKDDHGRRECRCKESRVTGVYTYTRNSAEQLRQGGHEVIDGLVPFN